MNIYKILNLDPPRVLLMILTMEEKKLFLIDAYAIIYRAYYALIRAPRVTSSGLNTSAIFGFVNALEDILKRENPSHIAVCFDPPHGVSFRNEMFPDYKAQRDAQPEDITLSIPYIKEIVSGLNIPVIEREGYEADDVIGTLAFKAAGEGFTTYMMTPDKDYGQLVTDRIFMYRPSLGGKGFEIRGPEQVCEKYGISSPRQVIDLLALMGDASDNIPGCPGVGEKTAVKLINEFGSVENLLANTDKLKGALQKKVSGNKDKIIISKELATICTDVPLPDSLTIDSLIRKPENIEALRDVYTRLEFRTFLRRLGGDNAEAGQDTGNMKNAPSDQPSLFDFIDEPQQPEPVKLSGSEVSTLSGRAEIVKFVEMLLAQERAGICVAAVGENAMDAEIKGVALSCPGKEYKTAYIPVNKENIQELADVLKPLFNQNSTKIVSHDIKRDMVLLRRLGISFNAEYFDTSVAHYLLQPEMRHSLSVIASTMLGYETIEDKMEIKTEKDVLRMSEADFSGMIAERAWLPLELSFMLQNLLKENKLNRLMDEIELPLAAVLADMEWTGVRVDTAELSQLSAELTSRLEEIENKVYEMAGEPFNIGSPKKVGEILFDKMQIDPKAKKTKTGVYSTTEEILESYAPYFPIVSEILKHRRLKKLLNTYINALPKLINPHTGHIHTTLNQTVTATGRISSTNPNLQNIPVRSDDGKEIRRAFIADEGCVILSADYSQIELRLLADLSADPDMIDAFESGEDFHTATAAKIFHKPVAEIDSDMRRKAKTASFGIVYGISPFGLSQRLSIPRAEAKALIDSYYATYPGVRRYMDKSIEDARANGYVTTIMDRKRFLPNINSRNAVVRAVDERNAVNAPIQGSAADIIKRAMIDIFREMSRLGLRSKMIMQVHDELIFNVVPEELPVLQKIVVAGMENAYPSSAVRLEVGAGTGRNWLEAH